ncbi:transposase [Nocardia brasiliensis]|uniref:transposase n=1 Tax=Nocardia brasiliensis TaxID=37326 RepID=UPI00366C00B2
MERTYPSFPPSPAEPTQKSTPTVIYGRAPGRIENCQVAVYLTYATTAGHAFIDRALYLPRSWSSDPVHRAQARVPADAGLVTKPALAKHIITAALDSEVPARWVTGVEAYGGDPKLRAELETRSIGYVFAIACDHRITAGRRAGPRRCPGKESAAAGVATALGRSRREGPSPLRLGLDRHRSRHQQRTGRAALIK